MGHLDGLQDYLDEYYDLSVFDRALDSKTIWSLHLHKHLIVRAKLLENLTYDIRCEVDGEGEQTIQKVEVKLLYPSDLSDTIAPMIKTDKKVADLALEALFSPHKRFFIKNKTLFPLMQEKEVLFFTLLEGERIKGLITAFSRYDITVNLKGGVPVTVMRHSVYDLRNKKGRCFLKSKQETLRDWEKSPLFVSAPQSDD